jgi:hypothetical protein
LGPENLNRVGHHIEGRLQRLLQIVVTNAITYYSVILFTVAVVNNFEEREGERERGREGERERGREGEREN